MQRVFKYLILKKMKLTQKEIDILSEFCLNIDCFEDKNIQKHIDKADGIEKYIIYMNGNIIANIGIEHKGDLFFYIKGVDWDKQETIEWEWSISNTKKLFSFIKKLNSNT